MPLKWWRRTAVVLPVGLLVVLLATSAPAVAPAGAAPASTHSSNNVRSWLKLHDVVFLSLQTDLKTLSTADDNGSTTAIAAACQQLQADVATIDRVPPIPQSTAEHHWSSALSDFRRGANDCVQGIVRNDQGLEKSSGPLLRSGVDQVNAALALLKRDGEPSGIRGG